MKGIILAGGQATRLRPASLAVTKQLMPVYDKPLIYYPLTTLILSGIKEILIICNPENLSNFKKLFRTADTWGIDLSYSVQTSPGGIAESLIIAETYLSGSPTTLILGDNLFHGPGLGRQLSGSFDGVGAQITAYYVTNPKEFGVIEFDDFGLVRSLEEKPQFPKSNWVVPGLYFFDNSAVERAKNLKRSSRGELEITDLNLDYMKDGLLKVQVLPRGTTWLDMGTPNSLLEASEYIRAIQERQGILVGSPEEAAWVMGLIKDDELMSIANSLGATAYAKSLLKILNIKY